MLHPDFGGPTSGRSRQHHRHFNPHFLNAWTIVLAATFSFPFHALAQSGLLEARVVSGEGQISRASNHLSRPLVVEVTDETGAKVEGAIVSFLLPEDGVSGVFRNGLKTEILKTDKGGRVALKTLETGGFAGRYQIRLTVAKGDARTGMVSNQYIAAETLRRPGVLSALRPGRRVLLIGGVVLGAAAAGYIKTRASGSGPVQQPPSIGTPTITIGKP